MTVSLLAAMASNRVIGRGNALPWRLPADLRRFRRLTMGHPVIVGRVTFESIGAPLEGRAMVVLSRREGYAPAGVVVARSVEEAIARAEGAEAIVIGGEQIYRQAIGLAGRIYLTVIEREYEGDARFPEIDPSRWRLASDEGHPAEGPLPPYRFQVYERVG